MFVANQDASERSQVKFFRCTNCIGAHVLSEPVSNDTYSPSQESELFHSSASTNGKYVQML